MKNLRKYGNPPHRLVLVHGGPGAAGEMHLVAKKLEPNHGVLEPLQTATSLEAQIDELKSVLDTNSDMPVTLMGFSWGAWLSFIFASRFPGYVSKLILIGCGPFHDKYSAKINDTRLTRLSDPEKAELKSIMRILINPSYKGKKPAFDRFAYLFKKADAFLPLQLKSDEVDFRINVFQGVWPEASAYRKSGRLLECGKNIQCPVIAIHGDYDPHPPAGVEEPLNSVLKDFRFVLLKNCGHRPWIERFARDEFYRIIFSEI